MLAAGKSSTIAGNDGSFEASGERQVQNGSVNFDIIAGAGQWFELKDAKNEEEDDGGQHGIEAALVICACHRAGCGRTCSTRAAANIVSV